MAIWSAEIKELETLYESLKGQLPDLDKELEHLIRTDDANVIMLYSRRCMEVIITDLCECELGRPRKTEPLKGIIDKLQKEEKVPSHIISSMHGLNELSTYGAHPKDFDPEQVKPVLNNLTIIIRWYLKHKELRIAGGIVQEQQIHADELSEVKAPVAGKPNRNIILVLASILVVAIIFIFPKIFKKDKFENIRDTDGKISVAVMPFDNLTGDTTLNWFGKGISSLIINGLGNSKELAVCDDNTMYEAMESLNQVYSAGISPSTAKDVARRVKVESYLSGSFQGSEDTYWILVNLVNTENGNIIWSSKVEGNLKSSAYLDLADSLCNEIKNYLEIKALENSADYELREVYPKSAEAYRYFIEGMNLVLNQNYESGIQSLKKAVEIDSAFTFASFFIAYAYGFSNMQQAVIWTEKTYNNKGKIPSKYQQWIELWHACYSTKNLIEINRYCDLLGKSGINTRLFWFDLGVTYMDFMKDYQKAVEDFEKVMEISKEKDDWKFLSFYDRFALALHKTGNHDREREVCNIGLRILPENSNWMFYRMAICALSRGDKSEADEVLSKYRSKHKELKTPEDNLELYLGLMYEEADILDQAETHFRKAHELGPQSYYLSTELARFLIYHDINTDEGMELISKLLEEKPDNNYALHLKGWGLYQKERYEESVQLLSKMWEISIGFDMDLYEHLEAAKKAVSGQKNN
jgi:TolB-like protein/Flp pilus assembly protein TadD